MVSAVQPKGQYRPDIDGLRAIAVMAVVLHHLSADWVPGGFIGVDVFFVISGYLITRIISREIADGTFTFSRFYERRIRRLFPALFTVLAFVLVAGWFVLLPSDYLATLRASAATLLFSANVLFWHVQTDYFAADAKLNPLLHMWSLGVEEQFYLLFPVVVLMIHRWMPRWLLPAMLAGFGLSLALSIVFTPSSFVASYFLLPTRAWEMLAGGLLAVIPLRKPGSRYWRELLALAAMLAILIPAFQYTQQTPFPGHAALLPVLGTAVLIWLGGGGAHGGQQASAASARRLHRAHFVLAVPVALAIDRVRTIPEWLAAAGQMALRAVGAFDRDGGIEPSLHREAVSQRSGASSAEGLCGCGCGDGCAPIHLHPWRSAAGVRKPGERGGPRAGSPAQAGDSLSQLHGQAGRLPYRQPASPSGRPQDRVLGR